MVSDSQSPGRLDFLGKRACLDAQAARGCDDRLPPYRFPAPSAGARHRGGLLAAGVTESGRGQEVRTSSVVHLPCAPASVAHARRVLSDELTAAGICDHAVGDAALVVSELVSNAILHAYPLPGERLKVAWVLDDGWVEVAVSDGGSATTPAAGHPTPASVSGRGLAIVSHICQTWGVRTDEVGLTVWAILPAPDRDRAANQTGLDQRTESTVGFSRTPPVQAVAGLNVNAASS